MKNQLTATLLLTVVIFLINACSNSDKVKVGYLVPNLKGDRYIREQNYFKEKISSLGGEALTESADYDDQKQIMQAQQMIDQGAKVIVVNSVNMNTAAAIVRYAHRYNVKVIAYDRLIRNSDLDYYISFNNETVGKSMAEYVLKLMPKGNYVLIGGDKSDLNAVLVKEGQMSVLQNQVNTGNIKIIYNIFVEEWSESNAYAEMKRFLNLSDQPVDAILSSYDGMTTGCIEALNEKGLSGKVLITGQDAELKACKNIMLGNQTMTVYKPLKLMAERAAEMAFKMAAGESIVKTDATINNGQKDVPTILLNPVVVDKNNMKTTVIADGFYTEDQLLN